MIEEANSGFKIVIPISDLEELANYQNGMLGILRKIEIDNRDPELTENLKYVYKLLMHLTSDQNFRMRQRNKTRL
jgi:hypothetical protein